MSEVKSVNPSLEHMPKGSYERAVVWRHDDSNDELTRVDKVGPAKRPRALVRSANLRIPSPSNMPTLQFMSCRPDRRRLVDGGGAQIESRVARLPFVFVLQVLLLTNMERACPRARRQRSSAWEKLNCLCSVNPPSRFIDLW